MTLDQFTLILSLFTIPWTLAGLIHPPAIGMGRTPRRRIFVYGCLLLVAGLSLSAILLPDAPTPANSAPGLLENTLTALLLLTCVAWPLAALVLKLWTRLHTGKTTRPPRPDRKA